MILTMLALLTLGSSAEDYNYLVFTQSDGTTKSIAAGNVTIAFADGNLTATSGSETVTIPLGSLTKMAFSNDGTTGIVLTTADGKLTADDAEVYDLNGRRLPSSVTLSRGIYILKSNGKTSKIQVR